MVKGKNKLANIFIGSIPIVAILSFNISSIDVEALGSKNNIRPPIFISGYSNSENGYENLIVESNKDIEKIILPDGNIVKDNKFGYVSKKEGSRLFKGSNENGELFKKEIDLESKISEPTIEVVPENTDEWTNQSYNVKLIITDANGLDNLTAGGREYKLEGKQIYEHKLYFSGNGTLPITVTNINGVTVTKDIEVTNIDRDKPNGLYNDKANVDTTFIDENTKRIRIAITDTSDALSGLKGFSFKLSTSTSDYPDDTIESTDGIYEFDLPIEDTTNYWLNVKAIDNAGNFKTTYISLEQKEILVSPSNTDYLGNSFTVKYPTTGAKLEIYRKYTGEKEYKFENSGYINSGGSNKFVNVKLPDKEPPNKIETESIDYLSDKKAYSVKFKESTDIGGKGEFYGNYKYKSGMFIERNSITNIVELEGTAGIKHYIYNVDKNPDTIPTSGKILKKDSDLTLEIPLSDVQYGERYIHIRAVDNNNNMSETTHVELQNDKEAPTFEIIKTPTDWTNGSVSFTVKAKDTGFGIDYIQFNGEKVSLNGAKEIEKTFTVNERDTGIPCIAVDLMGNRSSESVDTLNIDRDIPTSDNIGWLSLNGDGVLDDGYYLTVGRVEDRISGIAKVVFQTWTEKDGQDDLVETLVDEDTNRKYKYLVNRNDHNNEYGKYLTNVLIYDKAGNVKTLTYEKTIKDTKKPNLNVYADSAMWTRDPVPINIEAWDGENESGIEKIKLPDGTFVNVKDGETKITHRIEVTENGTFTFEAYDKFGNVTVKDYTVNWIDKIPPIIQVSKNNYNWTNQDVILDIGSWDNAVRVEKIKLPNGEFIYTPEGESTLLNQKYTITENGEYIIESYDHFGNVATHKVTITNIDKTKPVLNLEKHYNYTENSVSISIYGADPYGSGITRIKLPNGSFISPNEGQFDITSSFLVNHNNNYEFIAYDNAGNENIITVPVTEIVDNDKPNLNVYADSALWTDKPVPINIEAWDFEANGITGIEKVKLPNGEFVFAEEGQTKITHRIEVPDNGTFRFEAYDKAGNITVVVYTVNWIDKVPPVIQLGLDDYNWTKETNIDIGAWDNAVRVEKIELPNGEFVMNPEGEVIMTNVKYRITQNGTYTVKAYDHFGLVSEQSITVTNIDNTVPNLTLTQNITDYTNGTVTIRAFAVDNSDGSGIEKVKLPNGSFVTPNQGEDFIENFYEIQENRNYEFVAYDKLGNAYTNSINITNIDRVIPEIDYTVEYNENKTSGFINLTFSDNLSGISYVELPDGTRLNSVNTHKFKFDNNGEYLFSAYDVAGNKTNITVNISDLNISEIPSDINRIEYKLSGATTKDWTNYTSSFFIENEGVTTITVRAYDNAGNVSEEKSSEVKIDKSKPINNSIKIELK